MPAEITTHEPQQEPPLSKNAQKRLAKRARWEANADARKQARKDKKARAREARSATADAEAAPPRRRRSQSPRRLAAAVPLSPMRIVIDCAFDEKMLPREISSLQIQLARCHACNARATPGCSLAVTSFGDRLQERFESVLGSDHSRWRNTTFAPESVETVFAAERDAGRVVYLTGDSDNVLETLSDDCVYIVGGIVDRNREKGLCLRRAEALGLRHAQLPLREHVRLASRRILATNHVVEIMLKYLELGDWGAAFLHVLPKRKVVAADVPGGESGDEAAEEAQAGDAEGTPAPSRADAGPAAATQPGRTPGPE